ncbi:MAG: selenocysteine-specific translation elongation factor [Gemmatimonadetes bacterium]|nr:selenocysteine-specific translation elongation factor [Gemmatimonadota bacterium]MCY3612771.1 selenocysteine-specific translation elongation factor [Gemmatimonadota bacterium]
MTPAADGDIPGAHRDERPGEAGLILGTAGHIDHGKTALVQALTGVDTDRLAEEKRRGITIELGFARYASGEGPGFGIVDVPGHEGFVRTMVAGASGMDLVLMVVAADEGVMPQTREHLAIVRMLGVGGMVVAITKADLVDEEWLELVDDEVRELLAETPYEAAEIVPTSVRTGVGLPDLARAISRCAEQARTRTTDDLARLPVDRVFAMEGAGTVVTGTLWSGRLSRGSVVRILPRGDEARIRALQVHGVQVDEAVAGQRTAAALTGAVVRRGHVARGDVIVSSRSWSPSHMLTVSLTALAGSGWRIETGQRVRVHLGTVEVMGRVVLFGVDEAVPGEPVPAQLRLESPVVARCGDRLVVRSYSPVTTIAGGTVLEPAPPKRKRLAPSDRDALEALSRSGRQAVLGAAGLAGWAGLEVGALGVVAGWRRGASDDLADVVWRLDGVLFDRGIVAAGEEKLLRLVRRHHRVHPLEPGVALSALRTALPERAHPRLADGLASRLAARSRLVVERKIARLPGFEPTLSPAEEQLAERILEVLHDAGLKGPDTSELQEAVDDPGTGAVLRYLATQGRVRMLGDLYWVTTVALGRAATRVLEELGGREGLGPADFREVLPVTRKHLIPILAWLDARGVTQRLDDGRRVSRRAPGGTA